MFALLPSDMWYDIAPFLVLVDLVTLTKVSRMTHKVASNIIEKIIRPDGPNSHDDVSIKIIHGTEICLLKPSTRVTEMQKYGNFVANGYYPKYEIYSRTDDGKKLVVNVTPDSRHEVEEMYMKYVRSGNGKIIDDVHQLKDENIKGINVHAYKDQQEYIEFVIRPKCLTYVEHYTHVFYRHNTINVQKVWLSDREITNVVTVDGTKFYVGSITTYTFHPHPISRYLFDGEIMTRIGNMRVFFDDVQYYKLVDTFIFFVRSIFFEYR